MHKNRLVSFSITATTLLILGGAGCGELKDIADEILSHKGGGSGGSGGAGGATGSGCEYKDKVYSIGSSFPSADGCNVCRCEETGVACTLKACSVPPPSPTCEKIPVTAATGACVPFTTWKVQLANGDVCTQRGESMDTLSFGSTCEDGASTREVIVVCCKKDPANDVTCGEATDPVTGTPCTVCTDASGNVVKTDCRGGK